MAGTHKAGKTAPRLVEDIVLYDPSNPPGTNVNLLANVPPVYPDGYRGPLDYISSDACRHIYVTKTNQTQLAQLAQPRRLGMSKVSAVCSKCRRHLQVVVNYTNGAWQATQGLHAHVHHLVYKSGRQRGSLANEEVMGTGQTAETFHYACSHPSCSAMVSLRSTSPLLSPGFVDLLTNPVLTQKRATEAIAANPERLEGVTHPLPITVLDNLRLYLTNALRDPARSKPITKGNKRFIVSFGLKGEPCKDLFEFLGFEYRERDGAWVPPSPDPKASLPYEDDFCIFLDDAIHELIVLINQRPASEKRGVQIAPLPPSARDDLYFAVEASDYPKSKRAHEFEMPPAPFYEDLGAVEDMSASLIVDAYHRQVATDPTRTPRWIQALKSIAALRGGEDGEIIDQAVQNAYAEGKFTQDDVVAAYRYFDFSHDDPNLDEEAIVGKFYAFISSTTQDTEARLQLWRIGESRRSERIKAASEDRVSTLEQAQVFLGVDTTTPDDFIITMYTTKVNDSPSNKALADRAVQIIAESRKSEGLSHFIKTGEAVEGEMDIGDAYRMLQIPDRNADAEAVHAAYTICIDDNPGQSDVYARALRIIAKEMDNSMLKTMAGITTETTYDLSEWPVGLHNIGNTCYLNSLLQFYFSIKPYRDMVLSLEKFQMDMGNATSLVEKKVGSRKVAGKEIQRSLGFLRELRVLFRDMISSPNSGVTPGQELARLTLISPNNEEAIRRRSTVSLSRPHGLGEINGAQVLGPLGPPLPGNETEPSEDCKAKKDLDHSDTGSERTLIPGSPETEKKASYQSVEDNDGDLAMPDVSGPIPDKALPAPDRPPPVPPRNPPKIDREKQLKEEVEIGAQQDVTEVINNVLFQSQCAIKPRGFEEDGEQIDQIKNWFYGETRSYISTEAGVRSKKERWCDIKVDVAGGPRNIYEAIDGAFDAQMISVENGEAEQYGAISKLPPILQVQVQRVQFDPVAKKSYKSTNYLELFETIYLDRYMDTKNPEILQARRQTWEWKKQLGALETRRAELLNSQENNGYNLQSLLRESKGCIESLSLRRDEAEDAEEVQNSEHHEAVSEVENLDDVDKTEELSQYIEPNPEPQDVKAEAQLLNDLEKTQEAVENELPAINAQVEEIKSKLANRFETRKIPYQLYAVFVHRGSVSFGHYWIYIFDHKKNIWRKYNDEYVTEVQNFSEIFGNPGDTNPPTPYFLVYINSEMKDRLVDPVSRDIAKPSTSDADAPVSMEGVEGGPSNDAERMDLTDAPGEEPQDLKQQ